jgi:hypothetical protein
MGWRHAGLFAFAALSILALMVLGGGMDELVWPQLYQIDKKSDFDKCEAWIRERSSFLMVPFVLATGFVVDRYGRTLVLLGLLVISLGITGLAAFTQSTAGFVIAYGTSVNWLFPAIASISAIFVYEFVPLKHRLISLLCLGLAEPMGAVLMGLAIESADSIAYYDPLWIDRQETIYIVAAAAIAVTIAVGVIFTKGRDTILSMVNCGNEAGKAYDLTVTDGRKNTSEPVPLSREEYIDNAQIERAECPSLLSSLKGLMVGPFCVLASAGLINAIATKFFSATYWNLAVDFFGGENQESLIELTLLQHGLTIFGVLVAISLYVWIRDIRFVPPVGYLLVALGCVICASVNAIGEDGSLVKASTLPGALTASLGACLIVVSSLVAVSSMKVIIMDVFPTSCRGRGVFVFAALEYLFMGIVGSLYSYMRTDRWVAIVLAAIVAAVGVGVFASFYLTSWFEKSILFRDPELDACWLISSKLTNEIPIVGSRDKLRSPTPHTASTSSSAAAPMSF